MAERRVLTRGAEGSGISCSSAVPDDLGFKMIVDVAANYTPKLGCRVNKRNRDISIVGRTRDVGCVV